MLSTAESPRGDSGIPIIDWVVERFQDALLIEELDPGLFRRQGELTEKKDARIQQFLDVLRRAIGTGESEPRDRRRHEVVSSALTLAID